MAFGGILKQSTAVDILVGPMLDSTDGNTAETALTISQADVLLSKNGQALAQKTDATACAHDSGGMYNCELDATDTNTVGQLVVFIHESGALACRHEFQVIEEGIYDALFAASAAGFDSNQRVNVGQWLSQAVTLSTGNKPDVNVDEISDDSTAPANLELDYDGTGYNKANSTIGTTTTNTDMRGTDNAALATVLGAAVGASISADIADIPTVAEFNARTLPSADYVVTTDTIAGVTTCTTNTDMRGTDNAALASVLGAAVGASISADIAAVAAKTGNLPEGIQKNVALSNFEFLMVDETDFATPETGLTVSGQRSIDGAAFAAVTGAIAEVGNGMYQFDAAQADTNGDFITWRFTATGAAATVVSFKTTT